MATRANLESILIRRVGVWFTSAGLDGTTVNGTNADLDDPLATALLELGYTVGNITSVSDSDVSTIPSTDLPRVLALAELRALENAAQAFSTQEVSGLGYSIKTGTGIADAIKRLRSSIAARYGLTGGSITGGTLTLDFQDTTL